MSNALIYIFPVMLSIAAVSDIARYEIPNWVSVILAVGYVGVAVSSGVGLSQLALHVGAGLVVFAVGAILFHFKAFGGGDVKLLAASAVWVGWHDLVPFLIVVALAGGVVTLLLLVFRWANGLIGKFSHLSAAEGRSVWLKQLLSPDRGVPYGVAIGLAGLLIFSNVRDQLTAISGL